MKIIKEGDKKLAELKRNKVKRFECSFCGCIWEANKDEYVTSSQYNDEYYYSFCPCCQEIAYVYDR